MESRRGTIACLRCKSKKVKCNREIPKCTNCEKAGRPCLTIDPATGREVPRSYLNHLETRVNQLEKELEYIRASSLRTPTGYASTRNEYNTNGTERSNNNVYPDSRAASESGTTAYEDHASSNSERSDNISSKLPIDLPPKREAEELIKLYFEHYNAACPILHREQFIQQYFEPVYGPISADLQLCSKLTVLSLRRSSTEPETGTFYRRWVDCGDSMTAIPEPYVQICLFFVYMTFSFGALSRYDPDSPSLVTAPQYLAAAMTYYPFGNINDGLKDEIKYQVLQGMLLLSYAGLYMPTTPSAWFLIGSVVRLCIDMGLHNEATLADDADIDEYGVDLRRRLFWTAYFIDRVLSIRLGRPVNISDDYVDCPLPSLADDSWTTYSRRTPNSKSKGSSRFKPPNRPSFKWVFHSILWLLKLQHRIKFVLYDSTKRADAEELRYFRDGMLVELDKWRDEIPWDPGYFNFDWNTDIFQMSYHYTRILLYRPSRGIPVVNEEDLRSLLESTAELFRLYLRLEEQLRAKGETSQHCTSSYSIIEATRSCLSALKIARSFDISYDFVALGYLIETVIKFLKNSGTELSNEAFEELDALARIATTELHSAKRLKKDVRSWAPDNWYNADSQLLLENSNNNSNESVGSIPEGVSNAESPLDLLYMGNPEKSIAALSDNKTESPREHRLFDDRVLDILQGLPETVERAKSPIDDFN